MKPRDLLRSVKKCSNISILIGYLTISMFQTKVDTSRKIFLS